MFGRAVVNVIKKSWLLILGVVIVSGISLYWRDHQVSLFALCLIWLAALGGLLLIAVPVELHKLRNSQ